MSQDNTGQAHVAEISTQETETFIRQVRTRTRRKYAPEDKIRIVLEGFRREVSVSDLCRREEINQVSSVPGPRNLWKPSCAPHYWWSNSGWVQAANTRSFGALMVLVTFRLMPVCGADWVMVSFRPNRFLLSLVLVECCPQARHFLENWPATPVCPPRTSGTGRSIPRLLSWVGPPVGTAGLGRLSLGSAIRPALVPGVAWRLRAGKHQTARPVP